MKIDLTISKVTNGFVVGWKEQNGDEYVQKERVFQIDDMIENRLYDEMLLKKFLEMVKFLATHFGLSGDELNFVLKGDE